MQDVVQIIVQKIVRPLMQQYHPKCRQNCPPTATGANRVIGLVLKLMLTSLMLTSLVLLKTPVAANDRTSGPTDKTPFELNISSGARESVDNGVALTFDFSYALPQHFLFWTIHIRPEKHALILQRHALSNRYIVIDNSNETHIFPSIQASLDFISSLALDILKSYHGNGQSVAMQSRINTFKLPSPIRLKAFLSNDWDIDDTWYSWASEN